MRHRKFPLELIFWISALVLLFLLKPENHPFSLCPLANLGLTWCPGCGLGRAINYIFHGDFLLSLKMHWFGLPALAILLYRIVQLSRQFILSLK